MVTGWPDDERIDLDASHKLYPLAQRALREQHTWNDDEHRSFWWALVSLWPIRGKPRTADGMAEVARYLRETALLSADEIAAVLCVQPDTLRRREYLERGAELEERSPLDFELGSEKWWLFEAGGFLRGPWVYSTAEPTPQWVTPGADVAALHPDVEAAAGRAEAKLREMWKTGELIWVGEEIKRQPGGPVRGVPV